MADRSSFAARNQARTEPTEPSPYEMLQATDKCQGIA
jgi:hypothetical protein